MTRKMTAKKEKKKNNSLRLCGLMHDVGFHFPDVLPD